MSAVMDLYLSSSDSLSFQDMLDIDIKAEIETLVGGHNDFSSFNFSDLPPLELEDVHDIKWFSSSSNHSNSSLNLDFIGEGRTTMVNPNAVMPIMSLAQNMRSPSPSIKESHLTFSPATFKITSMKQEANGVKNNLIKKLEAVEKPVLKTISKVTPILRKQTIKTIKGVRAPTTLLAFRNPEDHINITQVNNVTSIETITSQPFNTKKVYTNRIITKEELSYPKPAYSYSCLIAMALKNSRSGSLPVSEIYNFMCKHFPYFKTAPNGWKNSVRHNLSLNKCFEKIEKPAINGSQRKGCLWAMNPNKISKMDEEVQKWSRKDPQAIKKAMVNPEHLEALERGEMKFSCAYDDNDNFGDSCGSAESEGSDYEAEVENTDEVELEYQDVTIKAESEEEFEVQIAEDSPYEDMEDQQELLRVEMALAQKELLEFDRSSKNKRRKIYLVNN